ncbi:MAG: hypothetical protein AAF570_21610, partial [Bacteroidota bacterium]
MENGANVNDDAGLEHEADVMGSKAVTQAKMKGGGVLQAKSMKAGTVQRVAKEELKTGQAYQKGVMKNPLYTYKGEKDGKFQFDVSDGTTAEFSEAELALFKIPKARKVANAAEPGV